MRCFLGGRSGGRPCKSQRQRPWRGSAAWLYQQRGFSGRRRLLSLSRSFLQNVKVMRNRSQQLRGSCCEPNASVHSLNGRLVSSSMNPERASSTNQRIAFQPTSCFYKDGNGHEIETVQALDHLEPALWPRERYVNSRPVVNTTHVTHFQPTEDAFVRAFGVQPNSSCGPRKKFAIAKHRCSV